MLETAVNLGAVSQDALFREAYLTAYRWMLLARVLDDKMASLYRAGKIHGGVFLSRGQEALSASAGLALRKGDVFVPLIRDLAGRLAFGQPPLDVVRNHLGSALGPMRGRDGNVHHGRPKEGILPMISHLGAMIAVVNGTLIAHRFQGIKNTVGLTSIGEGGTSTGAFHEALNQASIEKLPLVLLVANNQYAYSTSTDRQFACANLVDRAIGYGLTGHTVDGTDLVACLRVVGDAVNSARQGAGPQLVVAQLLRLCGHGEHDDASYVDPQIKQSPAGRDCLKVAEDHIAAQHWADAAELRSWRNKTAMTVETAIAQVQREPAPQPFDEVWTALSTAHLRESSEK
jgi:pyruvate dehydrogenase E1 component alpha subunit/2-oxoisovalerate dehydrogenase E1 component alpha subunit